MKTAAANTDLFLRQHVKALTAHLGECRARGAWPLRVRCLAEHLFDLTAQRLVTTVAVAGVVLSAALAAAELWS